MLTQFVAKALGMADVYVVVESSEYEYIDVLIPSKLLYPFNQLR